MLITKDFQKRITPNWVESMFLFRMRLHTEPHTFTTKQTHDKIVKQLHDYINHINHVPIKMNESIIILLKLHTQQTINCNHWQYFVNVLYWNILKFPICDMGRGMQQRSVAISLISCIRMLFQWILGMFLPVIFGFLATNWVIFLHQKRFVDGWLSVISSFVYEKKPYSSGTNYYQLHIDWPICVCFQVCFWFCCTDCLDITVGKRKKSKNETAPIILFFAGEFMIIIQV